MGIDRWLPTIGSGIMGCVLSLCGYHFWQHWQFWALFVTGLLWSVAGYRYGISRRNVEAVTEAIEQLRVELEKDTPKLLCLMVKSHGIVSKEVQRHIWTLNGMEAKSWKDEEELTLGRKIEK